MKVGAAITAFNESTRGSHPFEWIKRAVGPASAHELVSEVVVCDDGSPDWRNLCEQVSDIPKVSLHSRRDNWGVLANKVESVYRSSADFVTMIDSDNFFGADYFDHLATLGLRSDTMYCVGRANPELDFRDATGVWTLDNVERLSYHLQFGCLFNLGNCTVNREQFLELFGNYRCPRSDLLMPDYFGAGDRSDLKWRAVYDANDSAFIFSRWLMAGNRFEIVPELQYLHGSMTPEHRQVRKSSWDEAPAEKGQLWPIYLGEMLAKQPQCA